MRRRRHWYSLSTDSAGMTFPRLVSFDSAVWRIGRQGAAHAAILLGSVCNKGADTFGLSDSLTKSDTKVKIVYFSLLTKSFACRVT